MHLSTGGGQSSQASCQLVSCTLVKAGDLASHASTKCVIVVPPEAVPLEVIADWQVLSGGLLYLEGGADVALSPPAYCGYSVGISSCRGFDQTTQTRGHGW
jgi:hypothetical protein